MARVEPSPRLPRIELRSHPLAFFPIGRMTPRMSHWPRGNTTANEHSRRRTVLIVDDDDEIRHSTQNLLIMSNFNVLLAADGVEALKVLTRQPVDALVIDLMMPRLDGVGVVRALEEMLPEHRPAVIIVISFHYELHGRFPTLGVRRVLSKPVDVPTLVGELQAALNEHAAQSVPT